MSPTASWLTAFTLAKPPFFSNSHACISSPTLCLWPCCNPTWPILLQSFQLPKLVQSSRILLFCEALPSLFCWTLFAHIIYVWFLSVICRLLKSPSHGFYFFKVLELWMCINKFFLKWLLRALGKSFPFLETLIPYLKDKEILFYQKWQICDSYTTPLLLEPKQTLLIDCWLFFFPHCNQINI